MSVTKETSDTGDLANIYYSNHSTNTMRNHTHSIAIKQGTYVQLLALSTNLQDSFDKIIGRLIAEHDGRKKVETQTLQSDPQVCPPGKQIASVATLLRGDNING